MLFDPSSPLAIFNIILQGCYIGIGIGMVVSFCFSIQPYELELFKPIVASWLLSVGVAWVGSDAIPNWIFNEISGWN